MNLIILINFSFSFSICHQIYLSLKKLQVVLKSRKHIITECSVLHTCLFCKKFFKLCVDIILSVLTLR